MREEETTTTSARSTLIRGTHLPGLEGAAVHDGLGHRNERLTRALAYIDELIDHALSGLGPES
ncbi:hypothetical protein GCM10027563_30830 [Parasphingorhabdus pacifica]